MKMKSKDVSAIYNATADFMDLFAEITHKTGKPAVAFAGCGRMIAIALAVQPEPFKPHTVLEELFNGIRIELEHQLELLKEDQAGYDLTPPRKPS